MKGAKKYAIYLLSFPNRYLMSSTFARFQEHYESPMLIGKVFTWEEFLDAYAKKDGRFTYFNDWAGFNVPSSALRPFLQGKFDPLTAKERRLLDLVRMVPEPFYLIAVEKGDEYAAAHEIVHGLFTLVPDYRAAVVRTLAGFDLAKMRRQLAKHKYDASVHDDEINAYLITGMDFPAKDKDLPRARRALVELFRGRFGFVPNNREGRRRLLDMINRVEI